MLLELADVLGPCDRRDAATADHSPLWFLDAMSRYFAARILRASVARIFRMGPTLGRDLRRPNGDVVHRYVAETELAGGMDTQTAQLFHNQFTDLEEAMSRRRVERRFLARRATDRAGAAANGSKRRLFHSP